MDEKITAKVTALLEDVFSAGIKEGRELERQDIVATLSSGGKLRLPKAAPSAPATPRPPTTNGGLTTAVANALTQLREENPDGVLPDTITDYVQNHSGDEVTSRDIRQALRQMTLQGQARRIQGGRYIPADNDLFKQPGA